VIWFDCNHFSQSQEGKVVSIRISIWTSKLPRRGCPRTVPPKQSTWRSFCQLSLSAFLSPQLYGLYLPSTQQEPLYCGFLVTFSFPILFRRSLWGPRRQLWDQALTCPFSLNVDPPYTSSQDQRNRQPFKGFRCRSTGHRPHKAHRLHRELHTLEVSSPQLQLWAF